MAKITIHAPSEDIDVYLEEVVRQVSQGYKSGYVDHDTFWDSEGVDE